ncbi:uncharacterized protein LOC141685973 [Apium graveolens]|uniref:uncharacterized protein LOC141685973 n=1 Tax=Apium graveolens TaxID=4045 RepID=UPI003D7923B2
MSTLTDNSTDATKTPESDLESSYQSVALDGSHPLYLHPSDHPGQVLVVTSVLNGENFNEWKRSMSLALSAKNKLGFVTRKCKVPSESSSYFAHWQRCNDMIITWLLNSVVPEIRSSLVYIALASDVWDDINMRFSQSNGPRVFELKKALSSLAQENLTISGYYTKFKMLWDDLLQASSIPKCVCVCLCKAKKQQEQSEEVMKVTQFLMGLNEVYTNIRGQLLMMNHIPPLTTVLSLLQQEERKRNYVTLSNTTVESAALMSKARFPRSDFKKTDVKRPDGRRFNLECTYCHGKNHTKDRCFHLIGFPPRNKQNVAPAKANHQENNFVAQIAASSTVPTSTDKVESSAGPENSVVNCLSDIQYQQLLNLLNQSQLSQTNFEPPQSGATDHITCCHDLLSDLLACDIDICLPNGEFTEVKLKGTIVLTSELTLYVVLLDCTMKKTLGIGKLQGSLFKLLLPTSSQFTSLFPQVSAHCNAAHLDTSKLWHSRLGHIHFPVMEKISSIATQVETCHKFVSTDVAFYENIFPYTTSVSITSTMFPSDSSFIDDLVLSNIPSSAHTELEHQHSPSISHDSHHSHDNSPSANSHLDNSHDSDNTDHISSSDSGSATVLPIPEQSSRPIRVKQLPVKFSDYTGLPIILNKTCATTVTYPLHIVDFVQGFTPTYQAFVANSTVIPEPLFYSQAIKDSNWCKAMQLELNALEANNTWQITSLPPGKKAVGCKWIYKVKYKSDGTLERYKARLVAQGFTQTAGVDYFQTFAPVAKMATVRLLDITNAFLNGDLHEEVYMRLPPGVPIPASFVGTNPVYKLIKSIYGLRQSPREWFDKFSDVVIQFGFTQSKGDTSMFYLHSVTSVTVLMVYIDDIILTSLCVKQIGKIKEFLASKFKLKDLGHLNYFLGLEITRSSEGIYIHQRKYAINLMENTGLLAAKPSDITMEAQHNLQSNYGTALPDAMQYRRLVGQLIYLIITRPYISYPVHILSQFIATPTDVHWKAALKLVRYIKGNPDQGLFLSAKSPLKLKAFCDVDWATCPMTRRSLSGYCVTLGDSLISWKCKKQNAVARSSAEAEYRALTTTLCEITWLYNLLKEIHFKIPTPVPMYCDNTSAIHIAENPVLYERTKHIELDCHFIRDKVKEGLVQPVYLSTKQQPVDLLTKPLTAARLTYLLSKLGVRNMFRPANLKEGIRLHKIDSG